MTTATTSIRKTLLGRPYNQFLLVFLSFCTCLVAQYGTATLNGTITDPSGATIAGAQLTLESETQSASRQVVTDSNGNYVIPAIPPGTYRLLSKARGFANQTITGILLSSGQGSTLNILLKLPNGSQEVTVNEAPPLLETTTATVGGEISSTQFTSLPMLGRNFTSLVDILPGTTNVASADAGYASSGILGGAIMPSVNGQRQRDNGYDVDGAIALEPNFTRVGVIPPPEAIAEMKVEIATDSGASGWASGASINVVTKAGTDAYHGDLWEYFRNSDLNARSFFLPAVGAFHWNQFGASAGGPLVIPHLLSKKKAWYVFGWYEGVRITQASNYTALVPTTAQLNGNFTGSAPIYNPYTTVVAADGSISRSPFPNNQIPTSLLNTTALALAKGLYPSPNFVGITSGVNYLNTSSNINNSDQWSGRVDHQFGDKDNFYARYSDWKYPSSSVTLPSLPAQNYQRSINVVASDTHNFSSNFLLTLRFGMQYFLNPNSTGGPDLSQQTGLVSTFPAYEGHDFVPALNIPGYAGLGQSFGNEGPEYFFTYSADAQKVIGRHTVAFGGGFVRDSFFTGHTTATEDFGTTQTGLGANTGDPMASFLLGLPLDASRQGGDVTATFLFHNYYGYIQDSFRLTKKLTVNLGLRWDYISPPITSPGLGTFDWNSGQYYFDTTNPITGQAANIRRGLVPPDYNGWQPRAGLAYSLTPKTVLRASGGIFDDIFGGNQQSPTGAFGNWPYAFVQSVSGLNTTTPNAFLQDPFPGPPVASSTPLACNQCVNVDPSSSRQPYVEEWSASIQQQLTSSLMLELAYVGSHGVKLDGQIIDNTALYPSATSSYQSRQKWPQFSPYIMNGYNEFESWYQGGTLKAQKRYSNNLTLLVSYTYSKALDESDSLGSGGAFGLPDYNPTRFSIGQFKGPAGFDIRQVLSTSYVYDIPGKTGHRALDELLASWEASGIISWDTGVPYVVLLSTDNENIGVEPGRISEFPNLTCNPMAGFTATAAEAFNTGCYQLPTYGTAGSAGRHALYSPGLFNWNFSLNKKWPFLDRRDIEFRAEAFNVLNSTTFDPPNVLLGSPSFGQVSSTNRQPGRQLELALKFHF